MLHKKKNEANSKEQKVISQPVIPFPGNWRILFEPVVHSVFTFSFQNHVLKHTATRRSAASALADLEGAGLRQEVKTILNLSPAKRYFVASSLNSRAIYGMVPNGMVPNGMVPNGMVPNGMIMIYT